MFAKNFLFVLLIDFLARQTCGYLVDRRETSNLRYSVGLSDPLDSSLRWDFYRNDRTKLIFAWNITLINGYSGILAFSNRDLNTDRLDLVVFGSDEKLYNAFTDDESDLVLPTNPFRFEFSVKQKVQLDYGKKKQWTIEFIRPLDTCDEQKRNYVIDRGTVHILTGYLTRDDFKVFKQRKNLKIDENRMNLTLQRVQLLKSQVTFKSVPDDHPHLDYLNRNVLIPDVETTYWCTRFELPKNIMKKRHQIIRFDGVVSPQSEGVVHHMELFHCDVKPDVEIPEYDHMCTSEQKPMGLTPCRRVIGAWALGAENFTYPDETGSFIGGQDSSAYLVLEVHFNNPYLKKGIIDQSGIRIYYTDKLRPYEAGIMEIGLEYNSKNSIPPKAKNFRVSGYCRSECTRVGLEPQGITIFASQLHTHLNGLQTFTRIVRKNGSIDVLNIDRHYSPHFQEIRLLPKPVRVEPGDTMIHTCIYNTEIHRNMTFGGYGIRDEMCVNYMHYYPRSSLELCKTSVHDRELEKFFQTMNEYDNAATSSNKTIEENYASIRWTPLTTEILENFYEIAQIHLSCNGSDGNYLAKFNSNSEYYPLEPLNRDVPVETASEKCQSSPNRY